MRLIAFGGPLYEQGGGWHDVLRVCPGDLTSPARSFPDIEEAKREAERHAKASEAKFGQGNGAWWQVVDLDTLTIVYEQEIKYK